MSEEKKTPQAATEPAVADKPTVALPEQALDNVAGGIVGGCIPQMPIGPRKPPVEVPLPAI